MIIVPTRYLNWYLQQFRSIRQKFIWGKAIGERDVISFLERVSNFEYLDVC